MPRAIPPANQDAPSPEVNNASVAGGLPSGIPGGIPGGVLGGIPDGGTASLAAPIVNAPKAPVRVGGSVKRPRLISAVQPVYPLLAKQAEVQGIVSIDAVIDEHGNVVEVQAISGSPLLIPAALQAVAQWKYEPTYLNGAPVSLELTVDVTFRFH